MIFPPDTSTSLLKYVPLNLLKLLFELKAFGGLLILLIAIFFYYHWLNILVEVIPNGALVTPLRLINEILATDPMFITFPLPTP